MVDDREDTEKLIIEQAILAEEKAERFGREIAESMTPPDETFKAIIQFRTAGLLLSGFAEHLLRKRARGDEEAEKQVRNVLARVDAIVGDCMQKVEQALWMKEGN